MRFLVRFAVIVAILWALYSGAMAAKAYFELSNVVQEAVPRELGATADRATFGRSERLRRIREAIVRGAAESGIVVEPSRVSVTEENGALWVRVSSTYEALRVGERVVDIPISTSHSFDLSGR
jgi:hypothetical protein